MKHVLTASRKALLREMPRRLAALEQEGAEAFTLEDNRILWRGAALATLESGPKAISPDLRIQGSDYLEGPAKERLRVKLAAWLGDFLEKSLPGLFALERAQKDPAATGRLRAILFRLSENHGLLVRRDDASLAAKLEPFERRYLAHLGIRLGTECLYMPAFFESESASLNARLWALQQGEAAPTLPGPEVLCFEPAKELAEGALAAMGYVALRPKRGPWLAIRADALERLAKAARKLARQGPFQPLPALSNLIEAGESELETALTAIGYAAERDAGGLSFRRRATSKRRKAGGPRKRAKDRQSESPFAKLRQLNRRD